MTKPKTRSYAQRKNQNCAVHTRVGPTLAFQCTCTLQGQGPGRRGRGMTRPLRAATARGRTWRVGDDAGRFVRVGGGREVIHHVAERGRDGAVVLPRDQDVRVRVPDSLFSLHHPLRENKNTVQC